MARPADPDGRGARGRERRDLGPAPVVGPPRPARLLAAVPVLPDDGGGEGPARQRARVQPVPPRPERVPRRDRGRGRDAELPGLDHDGDGRAPGPGLQPLLRAHGLGSAARVPAWARARARHRPADRQRGRLYDVQRRARRAARPRRADLAPPVRWAHRRALVADRVAGVRAGPVRARPGQPGHAPPGVLDPARVGVLDGLGPRRLLRGRRRAPRRALPRGRHHGRRGRDRRDRVYLADRAGGRLCRRARARAGRVRAGRPVPRPAPDVDRDVLRARKAPARPRARAAGHAPARVLGRVADELRDEHGRRGGPARPAQPGTASSSARPTSPTGSTNRRRWT